MSATLIKLAHHLSAQNPTDPLTLHEERAAPAPGPQKTPCLTGHLLLVSINTFFWDLVLCRTNGSGWRETPKVYFSPCFFVCLCRGGEGMAVGDASCGSRCMVQPPVTLCPQPRIRRRRTLVFNPLSSDSSPWDGTIHIQGGIKSPWRCFL